MRVRAKVRHGVLYYLHAIVNARGKDYTRSMFRPPCAARCVRDNIMFPRVKSCSLRAERSFRERAAKPAHACERR